MFLLILGRKRNRGVDAFELVSSLVSLLLLLERKLQLDCNRGVEADEEEDDLKKLSFPEVVLGVETVFC